MIPRQFLVSLVKSYCFYMEEAYVGKAQPHDHHVFMAEHAQPAASAIRCVCSRSWDVSSCHLCTRIGGSLLPSRQGRLLRCVEALNQRFCDTGLPFVVFAQTAQPDEDPGCAENTAFRAEVLLVRYGAHASLCPLQQPGPRRPLCLERKISYLSK